MPKTKISEFSSTPASNTDIDSINISEGCAPSGINDAIRELMAQLKDFQTGAVGDSFNGPVGTTTAAAGAFTTLSSTGNTTLGDASGDSVTINGTATFANANPTLSAGTANGVAYLNGSKVVTSGSALTFDGTNLALTGTSPIYKVPTAGGSLFDAGGNNGIYILGSSNYVATFAGGSEQMRLTSTGLGIGTSSPAAKLHIKGSSNPAIYWENSSFGSATNAAFMGSAGQLIFGRTGVADWMTIDNSGNLGLGVTPTAVATSDRVLQIRNFLINDNTNGYGIIRYNNYFNGTSDTYLNTGAVSAFQMQGNAFKWYQAPSGTAGNAITFTQAMTLDASGRLLVGVTSPSSSTLNFEVGATAPIARINATGGGTPTLSLFSSGVFDWTIQGGTALKFSVDGSEKSRIDSSGNLLVGTTSSIYGERITASAATGKSTTVFLTDTATEYGSIIRNTASSGNNGFMLFQTEAGGSATTRGSITYNRTAGLTSYNTTSDYRAKDIYGPVTGSGALIDSTPVYMGKMKGATQERPMFIAHETPDYAHTGEKDAVDKDGNPVYQQMDASALIPVMWAEIQSLRKRLADAGL